MRSSRELRARRRARGFQIEVTARAHEAGAVIAEVPIVFRELTAGTSKMTGSIVREALSIVTRDALVHARRSATRGGDALGVEPIVIAVGS